MMFCISVMLLHSLCPQCGAGRAVCVCVCVCVEGGHVGVLHF